jgi:tRNA(Glu) U13 pseudouridine synthase TruD
MIGRYPENEEIKGFYEDVMKEDDISYEDFNNKGMDAFCSNGSYRKIVARGYDYDYDIIGFNDPTEDLLNPHYIRDKKEVEMPSKN